MTFKSHLLIITAIIAAVFIAWHQFRNAPEPSAAPVDTSNRIIVAHASWGLNCNERLREDRMKLQDNNVRDRIVSLCDGKTGCTIPINSLSLGADPAPLCLDKILKVEYRCFSYDRLREVRAMSGNLRIECEQGEPAAPNTL